MTTTSPLPRDGLLVFPTATHLIRWLTAALAAAVVAMATMGFLATPMARVATHGVASVVAVVAATLVLFIVLLWRQRWLITALGRLADRLAPISLGRWLIGVGLLGIALRLVVFLAADVEQTRDKLAYWTIAQLVAAGEPIVIDTYLGMAKALYPPGLGFWLTPVVAVFGPEPLALFGFNIVLFALAIILTAKLCTALHLPAAARIAPLIIALWPNHIVASPMATKELVVGLAVPTLLLLVLAAARRGYLLQWRSVLAGVLVGATALTQPAMALLGASVVYWDWLRGWSLRGTIARATVVALVSFAVIAPWAVRNYQVFGSFVPFTTAGGVSFFLANNDRATGQFVSLQ